MYFKNKNGEKVKENFQLSNAAGSASNNTTPPPKSDEDSNSCQNGFFDLTTILLLLALIVVLVLLWKYDEIFPNEGGDKAPLSSLESKP